MTVTKDNSVSDNMESRECFYCHGAGHLISVCIALKRKVSGKVDTSKNVALNERRVSGIRFDCD